MNLLTFLKDNTFMKKRESSSSDESISPKVDRRHNNNVVFKIQDMTENKSTNNSTFDFLNPNKNPGLGGRNSTIRPVRGLDIKDVQVLSADDRKNNSNSQSSLNASESSAGNQSARSRTSNFREKANKSKLKGMYVHKKQSGVSGINGVNRAESRLNRAKINKTISFKVKDKRDFQRPKVLQNKPKRTIIINNPDQIQMYEKHKNFASKFRSSNISPSSFLNKLNGELMNTLMGRRKSKFSKPKKSFMLMNPCSPKGGNRFLKISPQIREGSMSTGKRMTKRNTKFCMIGPKLSLLT